MPGTKVCRNGYGGQRGVCREGVVGGIIWQGLLSVKPKDVCENKVIYNKKLL